MAATLQEILLAPDTQPKVIADCHTLIEQEISDKSGISGTAVKLAYKTVNTFAPGHVHHMLEDLLPRHGGQARAVLGGLQRLRQLRVRRLPGQARRRGGEALLSVTDARAAASERPTIIKAYRTVRGSAAKHVQAALPHVGDLVLKYAPDLQ